MTHSRRCMKIYTSNFFNITYNFLSDNTKLDTRIRIDGSERHSRFSRFHGGNIVFCMLFTVNYNSRIVHIKSCYSKVRYVEKSYHLHCTITLP